MKNCTNCDNVEYTKEGSINYYYRCKITGYGYLTQQAESYCCNDYEEFVDNERYFNDCEV